MKRCTQCQKDYPLQNFRRLHRAKIRTMQTCNSCAPPKRLGQMTPKERQLALQTTHRNHSPMFIERLNAAAKARRSETLSRAMVQVHAKRRSDNWDKAIIKPMRDEHRWARDTLKRYKASTNTTTKYQAHIPFFETYYALITRILETLSAKATLPTAPTKPSKEDTNPRTYITDNELQNLKALYADCIPIPGARPAREPWFLSWREN